MTFRIVGSYTALMTVAMDGDGEAKKVLIKEEADVNVEDEYSAADLTIARKRRKEE